MDAYKIIFPKSRIDHKMLSDLLIKDLRSMLQQRAEAEEEIITFMLRTQVKPPIKGEITKGKIRWRGLSIVRLHPDNLFMGLLQRGKFIEPNWRLYELKRTAEKCWLVGMKKLRDDQNRARQYLKGGIWSQIKRDDEQL